MFQCRWVNWIVIMKREYSLFAKDCARCFVISEAQLIFGQRMRDSAAVREFDFYPAHLAIENQLISQFCSPHNNHRRNSPLKSIFNFSIVLTNSRLSHSSSFIVLECFLIESKYLIRLLNISYSGFRSSSIVARSLRLSIGAFVSSSVLSMSLLPTVFSLCRSTLSLSALRSRSCF